MRFPNRCRLCVGLLGALVTIASGASALALAEMHFPPHITGAERAARRDANAREVETNRRLTTMERWAKHEPGARIFEYSKTMRQERLNEQAQVKELIIGKSMANRVEPAAKERSAEIYLGRYHYELPKSTWKPVNEMTLKELRNAEIQAIRQRTGGSREQAFKEQSRRDRADNVAYLLHKLREGYAIRDIGREQDYWYKERSKTDSTFSERHAIRLAASLVGYRHQEGKREISKDMVVKAYKEKSESQFRDHSGDVTTFKLQKIRPAVEPALKNNEGGKR